MMETIIRPEHPEDIEAIAEVTRRAFGREEEADIVARIRESEYFIPELSLVAESGGRIIGHIMFSYVTLISFDRPAEKVLTLAPLSVDPDEQNSGTGSSLVWAGLEKAGSLGHRIVIVIGHADYYPKFGFKQARPLGFDIGFKVPDEAFMVAGLKPGALQLSSGMIQFSPPFGLPTSEPDGG